MADKLTIQIDGAAELSAKLIELGKKIDSDEVLAILKTQAQVVRQRILSNTPQGPTGNLRRGVKARAMSPDARFGPVAIAAMDYKVAHHAYLVAFGTRARFKKKEHGGWYTGRGPANPFFRDAIESSQAAVSDNIIRAVGDLIDKAMA